MVHESNSIIELALDAATVNQDVEGVGVRGDAKFDGVKEGLFGEADGVGGRVVFEEGGKEGVEGEEVRLEAEALHLVEELEGEIWVVGEGVGGEGGVEEGPFVVVGEAEEEGVERVVGVVGGDEGEEEGFGVGELAVGEKGREESKEGLRGGGE